VIEQRAIAMLGDDGDASLSEIFAQAGVAPIGIRDALTRRKQQSREPANLLDRTRE
jgi:hypothetical protein